jgi:hypothetical protein
MNDQKKQIKITCGYQKLIPTETLQNFQGNLKELSEKNYDKLKRLILKRGFRFPVFVWRESILDGHQRLFVVSKLIDSGYHFPECPCVEIEAESETEAAEMLLELNSSYGKITPEGLYEFGSIHGIDWDMVLPDIELPQIDTGYFTEMFLHDPPDIDGFFEESNENKEEEASKYGIYVECENEKQQVVLLEKFEKDGIKCRSLIS